MAKTTKAKRNTNHAKKVKQQRARRVQAKRAGTARGRKRWNDYRKANVLPRLKADIDAAVAHLDRLGGKLPFNVLVPQRGGEEYTLRRPSKAVLEELNHAIAQTIGDRIDHAAAAIRKEFPGEQVKTDVRDEMAMVFTETRLADLRVNKANAEALAAATPTGRDPSPPAQQEIPVNAPAAE